MADTEVWSTIDSKLILAMLKAKDPSTTTFGEGDDPIIITHLNLITRLVTFLINGVGEGFIEIGEKEPT